MPKIKMPKSSPSIDMTPMVDLAFLLVTFFMLSASFREDDAAPVDIPASIADKEIPKNAILITIDKGDKSRNLPSKVYFGLNTHQNSDSTRLKVLSDMSAKYNVKFTKEQMAEFSYMANFGVSMKNLPAYLDLEKAERQNSKYTTGIPLDSTNNQLRDWIRFSNLRSMAAGEAAYLEEVKRDPEINMNEYKPKFILKVDGNAVYSHAKNVIEVFRDLELTNLYFVTSMELQEEK
jgi:biopolymer transport protein ExbD